VLRHDPSFTKLRDKVIEIASLIEEQASIPMVRAELVLLEEIQSEEWWQDVTVTMLEQARKKLRSLVRFIEKRNRKLLYTDFQDEVGAETEFELIGVLPKDSMERFRQKVQSFLRQHEDNVAIHRLRMNKPLTASDLNELEAMLAANGVGDADSIRRAAEESQGLGLFVR
jgi:type I restriction enzyme, R subunit